MKYKVGDKVRIKSIDWYNSNKDENGVVICGNLSLGSINKHFCGKTFTIKEVKKDYYLVIEDMSYWNDEMIEGLADEEKDKGEVSDGYHTFNELYEYRLLYNASMFNELAKQGLYDVHKSKRHSDGEIPFGDSNWFIVMAELPTGQISNHYEMKDWNLFQIPEKEKANVWDGHTPKDVAERIRKFLTPKPKHPTTYEECCEVLGIYSNRNFVCNGLTHKASNYDLKLFSLLEAFKQLIICRDAYWKIAGEEMRWGKSWEPDWNNLKRYYAIRVLDGEIAYGFGYYSNRILAFPTEEMRDAFYENFKDLIEECKELL